MQYYRHHRLLIFIRVTAEKSSSINRAAIGKKPFSSSSRFSFFPTCWEEDSNVLDWDYLTYFASDNFSTKSIAIVSEKGEKKGKIGTSHLIYIYLKMLLKLNSVPQIAKLTQKKRERKRKRERERKDNKK